MYTMKKMERKVYVIFMLMILTHCMSVQGMEEIFYGMYYQHQEAGYDSLSGPGSGLEQTSVIRKKLPQLLQRYYIKTLLDIPCGDYYWMNMIDQSMLKCYIGIDVIPELIQRNEKTFGDDTHLFYCGDITTDTLPYADLILCRDCLVHFSYDMLWSALAAMKKSGAKYLLATTFPDHEPNIDIVTGQWRPLNLQAAPFNFPDPVLLMNEKCTEGDGAFADKSLGLWRLGDVPPLPLYIFYTPSHEKLRKEWFLPSLQDYFILHEKQYAQECPTARWMSPGWTRTTKHKIEIILQAIEEQWGGIFVYADVDIQFFAPVTNHIMRALKDTDIVFQKDDDAGTVCTGFFACRAHEKTKKFFQEVYKLMQKSSLHSDQPMVNFCLEKKAKKYGIRWEYLPDIFWSGGHALSRDHEKFFIPQNIVMHHANGAVNVADKMVQLRYVKNVVDARRS